jgi:hypothetical protein
MDFANDTVIEWSIDTDSAETARTVSWKYAPNTEEPTATITYFTNFPLEFLDHRINYTLVPEEVKRVV